MIAARGREITMEREFIIANGFALPTDAVTRKLAFIGQSGSGKSYAVARLVEEMLAAGQQVVVLDSVGNWYGLRVAADGRSKGFDVPVFGGDHGDLPLDPRSGKLIADIVVDHGTSAVIDTLELTVDEQRAFFADFATQLLHRKKKAKGPLHVVLEEAQDLAPQDQSGGGKLVGRVLAATERLVKVGRNYGLGFSMISQQPQAVSKRILNQADALFALRLPGDHERKAIDGWVSMKGADRTLLEDLPELPDGDAIVYSPLWLRVLRRIHFAPKRTLDASATPDRSDTRSALPPLDLATLRAAIADTMQRATENDPEALKLRIAELEEQLRGRSEPREHTTAATERAALAEKRVEEAQQHIAMMAGANVTVSQTLDELMDEIDRTFAALKAKAHAFRVVMDRVGDQGYNAIVAFPPPKRTSTLHVDSPAPANVHRKVKPENNHRDVKPANMSKPRVEHGEKMPTLGGGAPAALLRELVRWHPKRLTREQLAIQAAYSVNSSTFSKAMTVLRQRGFLDEDGSGYGVTQAGRAASGKAPPAPRTSAEMIAAWREKIPGGAPRALFDVLVEHHPDPVERARLAKEAGYSEDSSTFSKALTALRSPEMIEDVERGKSVRASRWLFVE